MGPGFAGRSIARRARFYRRRAVAALRPRESKVLEVVAQHADIHTGECPLGPHAIAALAGISVSNYYLAMERLAEAPLAEVYKDAQAKARAAGADEWAHPKKGPKARKREEPLGILRVTRVLPAYAGCTFEHKRDCDDEYRFQVDAWERTPKKTRGPKPLGCRHHHGVGTVGLVVKSVAELEARLAGQPLRDQAASGPKSSEWSTREARERRGEVHRLSKRRRKQLADDAERAARSVAVENPGADGGADRLRGEVENPHPESVRSPGSSTSPPSREGVAVLSADVAVTRPGPEPSPTTPAALPPRPSGEPPAAPCASSALPTGDPRLARLPPHAPMQALWSERATSGPESRPPAQAALPLREHPFALELAHVVSRWEAEGLPRMAGLLATLTRRFDEGAKLEDLQLAVLGAAGAPVDDDAAWARRKANVPAAAVFRDLASVALHAHAGRAVRDQRERKARASKALRERHESEARERAALRLAGGGGREAPPTTGELGASLPALDDVARPLTAAEKRRENHERQRAGAEKLLALAELGDEGFALLSKLARSSAAALEDEDGAGDAVEIPIVRVRALVDALSRESEG